MKTFKLIFLITFCCSMSLPLSAGDILDRLIEEYSTAGQIDLSIRIKVVSEIFNSIDTTMGSIIIADDGRYRALINDDIYIFDGLCIWEYSSENNQATKDCLKEGEYFESGLIFIKNLDKYYDKLESDDPNKFEMKKSSSEYESLPDSLTVILHKGYYSLQYYDLNDDLNIIAVLEDSLSQAVDPTQFEIKLPDSTEIILMP